MRTEDIFAQGLGLTPPWQVLSQRLDTEKTPHELHLVLGADRGATYPCPTCGRNCKAHDFEEFTWRHLNFFQHHCYLTARVPRVTCPKHATRRTVVPWARPGSNFTLLFEQVVMILAREMPVATVASFVGTTDKRLWRVINHYVAEAMKRVDLSSGLSAIKLGQSPA